MTPSFFRLMCMGSIVCLTPLAVYLVWVVTVNRKPRPTVVDGVADFTATLAGLAGFFFCLGLTFAGIALDADIITGGRMEKIPDRMPWRSTVWLTVLIVYLAAVIAFVLVGFLRRRHSLQVFNADLETVEGCLADAFLLKDLAVTRRGYDWHLGGACLVKGRHFHSFRATTLDFAGCDAATRVEIGRHLREQLPKQPAAAENPAAQWAGTVLTCSVVAVGCSVVLIFAAGLML